MRDEEAFLAAIRAMPDDDAPRLIYADWLDENGRPGGSFLRIESEWHATRPDDPKRETLQAALVEAGVGVDPAWVTTVSRVDIENCRLQFDFACPQKWEHLQPTPDADVRYCQTCEKSIYFCHTLAEAHQHAAFASPSTAA